MGRGARNRYRRRAYAFRYQRERTLGRFGKGPEYQLLGVGIKPTTINHFGRYLRRRSIHGRCGFVDSLVAVMLAGERGI